MICSLNGVRFGSYVLREVLAGGDWVNSGVPDESLSPRIWPMVWRKEMGDEDYRTFDIDLDEHREKRGINGFLVPPRVYGECTRFHTSPLTLDDNERRDTFVRQFRPCGHYDKIYSDVNCQDETTYRVLLPNVDYPQRGPESDLLDKLFLVKFDVGRHEKYILTLERTVLLILLQLISTKVNL